MKKNLNQKIALIIGVVLVCIWGIIGIPSGLSGAALKKALTDSIHLGLDLQGGVHLILQVKVEEAINAETDNTAENIRADLKKANLSAVVQKPDPNNSRRILLTSIAPAQASAIRSLLDRKYSNDYDISGGGENGISVTFKPNAVAALQDATTQKAIDIISDRVNSLGVSEPVIQKYGLGDNQILVELPGISDMDKVKDIIQSTAALEVHPVIGSGGFPNEQAALASVGGTLPPDQMLMHGSGTMATGSDADQVFILQRAAVVRGNDFRSASQNRNGNTGQLEVQFTLTNEAGDKFYDYTKANIGNYMAVVMGNTVREVAVIKGSIRDTGVIEGTFTQEEVARLSKLLQTGALPASLEYLEDRTVGASMGADSVRAGVTAAVAGVLVVMAFMLFYYRGAGINADLALILNLIILLGVMGLSSVISSASGNGGMTFTMTLPGIAGVILTIGMGVDSNVLIFERIREEVRAGKAPSAAVDQGFKHAWVTIVDTHVTTIVSAAILFMFGTGPVKGFAVTLTIGLLANLFTAVFVSRVIFDAHLNKMKPGETVSI